MRRFYPALLLLALTACDENGGMLPIDGQKLLSSFDGPKITTMQDSQVEAAKAAERNDDFAGAAQIYQQVLEKSPEATDVALLYSDSLRRSGDYDKAIGIYDNILARDSSNLSAKEGKGLALMAKGDFETPTSLFDDVLKADGKRWKSLNGMGILFVTRGLYPESMKYFEEALKQSPTNTSIMNNLGLSQALNKQYDPAIASLTKASGQTSLNSLSRKRIDLNLALVFASAGKLDDARKIAETYLSGPSLNNNLGLYAHLAKDDGLAKSYLNMALTESKTYYSKAWENLESINSVTPADNKSAAKEAAAEKEKAKENTKGKTAKNKKAKPTAKEPGKVTIIQEPTATKSEVKSLGQITAQELQQGNTAPNAQPAVIMPNNINTTAASDNKSAVDNVIDDMAKSAAQNKPTAKPASHSLGTIRMPVPENENSKDKSTPAAEQPKGN